MKSQSKDIFLLCDEILHSVCIRKCVFEYEFEI